MNQTTCGLHGRQGIGLVCVHVARAIDSGELVGFFWGDDTDTARPDAWCRECEQALLAVTPTDPTDAWFLACQFKIICSQCWDLAKHRLYDLPRAEAEHADEPRATGD